MVTMTSSMMSKTIERKLASGVICPLSAMSVLTLRCWPLRPVILPMLRTRSGRSSRPRQRGRRCLLAQQGPCPRGRSIGLTAYRARLPHDRILGPDAANSVGGCQYSAGMNYGLFSKFSAQTDRRDDLVNSLLQAAKLLERNPGCIHYIISTSDEPEAVWVYEVWTSMASHDASIEPQDIQALIQKARPLITGMSDQTQLTVHGGMSLPG